MRFAFFIIRLLVIFGLLRYAIGFMVKLIGGAMRSAQFPAQQQPANSRSSEGMPTSAGELRKDPVCGTFIPVGTSLKKTVNGETVHFCSADCRDKFKAA
ncbi:MAG: hypothetical protein M3Z36_07115 [Acidobacteriota bacterium]|nr:hypothetical protein [Acidobacteriota bacterium]